MASTKNILSTLIWTTPFIRFQPLLIGGEEPALTAANMTLQLILGPPFQWRWNRNIATFDCIPAVIDPPALAVQDYTVTIDDYGFEEVASVADTTGLNKEITFKKVLALDGTNPDRPAYIAAQNDDNQGDITFRISPPPDQAYEATVTYQKKPSLIQSLAGTWAPIPDEYSYIYNWGFLTMAAMLVNDPRMPAYSQKFVGHLLSAQSGLTERQINIFMSTYLQRTGQVTVAGLTAQQGVTARTF